MKAPKRIILIALILISFSLFFIGSTVLGMAMGIAPKSSGIIPEQVMSIIGLIGGVITIVCSIGFLKRKESARKSYLVYLVFSVVIGIANTLTVDLTEQLKEIEGVVVDPMMVKGASIAFILFSSLIPIAVLYTKKSNQWFSLQSIQEQNNQVAQAEETL